MKFLPKPKGFTFRVGRPQRLAAVLLLLFFGQCLWVIGHQRPTTEDYRYARCGRETLGAANADGKTLGFREKLHSFRVYRATGNRRAAYV